MSIFARGNTALITGGASGVGLAVAKLCRQHGMKLALVDNNAENLDHAKQALGNSEQTEVYAMDVSNPQDWQSLKQKVSNDFQSGVDLLHLNAAISLKGTWGDEDYFQKIMNVNLFGIIHGLNAFVPIIQRQAKDKPAVIVLTGSKQGITNPPGNPAYNASKAAIKSLAEHLSYDMKGTNVSVHLLVPGWTFTGLTGGGPQSTKDKPAGAWEPEQVADMLKKRIDDKQFWVICPDNEVTESADRKRMMWTAGDAVFGRPPLSRWRGEYKEQSQQWMDQQNL